MSRPRVTIACCNGDAYIHKSVVFAVCKMLADPRVESRFIAPTHSPFVRNLHRACHDFLKDGADFLLLVDDDNPPQRNPLDLVFLGLDVVGLPTPVWHCDPAYPNDRPYYLNAMREVETSEGKGWKPVDSLPGFEPAGLQAVDAVGTGCVLIARRVLVELFKRCKGNPMEAPFMRRWTDSGDVVAGNDFAFCQRARAAGFRVWAHFDYMCDHHHELSLTEAVNALSKRGA